MDFQPNTTTMASYCIYRDGPSNEPFDPTAPLQFFPPKDSDELFFALRQAFPNVATHSERMRNAVIDFLLNEGATQQHSASQPIEQSNYSSSTSPYSPYISMTSSASSSSASPSLFESQSPPTVTSPSNAGESSTKPKPAIEQMTSVFSLSSHSEPKLRSRRKMTEAEKVEYRKRRSAGACGQCSARKRKCKHAKDQAHSESSLPASSNRVSKPVSQKQRGKQPQTQQPTWQQSPGALPSSSHSLLPDQSSSLDFSSSAQSPDGAMSLDNELFPWQTESDWTLLDMPPAHHSFPLTDAPLLSTYQQRSGSSQHVSHLPQDSLADNFFDLFDDNFESPSSSGPSAPSSQANAFRPSYPSQQMLLPDSLYAPLASFGLQTTPGAEGSSRGSQGSSARTSSPAAQPASLSREIRVGASGVSTGIAGGHRNVPSFNGTCDVSGDGQLQPIPSRTKSAPASSSFGNNGMTVASVQDIRSPTLQISGHAFSSSAVRPSASFAVVASASAAGIAASHDVALPHDVATSHDVLHPRDVAHAAPLLRSVSYGRQGLDNAALNDPSTKRLASRSGASLTDHSVPQGPQTAGAEHVARPSLQVAPAVSHHADLQVQRRLPAAQEDTFHGHHPSQRMEARPLSGALHTLAESQAVPDGASSQLSPLLQVRDKTKAMPQASLGNLQPRTDPEAQPSAVFFADFLRAVGQTQWDVLCALRDASQHSASHASFVVDTAAPGLALRDAGGSLVAAC